MYIQIQGNIKKPLNFYKLGNLICVYLYICINGPEWKCTISKSVSTYTISIASLEYNSSYEIYPYIKRLRIDQVKLELVKFVK